MLVHRDISFSEYPTNILARAGPSRKFLPIPSIFLYELKRNSTDVEAAVGNSMKSVLEILGRRSQFTVIQSISTDLNVF